MKRLRPIISLVAVALAPVCVAAAGPIDLAGTEWGFSGEIGKNVRYLQFRSNNKVAGSTGCNRFTGTYGQDGFMVTIGTLATTRRACLPEVMEREQQFLALLSKVAHAEVTHLKLTLKDAGGTVLVELVRRNPG